MSIRSALCLSLCVAPLWAGCSLSWGEEPESDAGPSDANKSRGLMLSNVKAQAAMDECPAGGVNVELGIDENGDDVLSADEVTRIVSICNGESGKNALIEVRDEAEGDGCPSGGIRVLSGLDADADGTLDDAEVVRNELLCHGSSGTNGVTTIVQLQEVDAGDECVAGGVNIIIGIDMDGDDALSPQEVRQEGVVCHGEPGPPGTSCTVTRDEVLGVTTVTCEDGTSAVISDGNDCSTERDETSASTTIRCEDGTEVVVRDGATGESGAPGTNCSVTRNESAGTATVNCEDGTSATIQDGRDGANGTSCTVTRDESAGSTTIACEDGTTATVHDGKDGAQGPAGPRGDAGPAGPTGPSGTDGSSCTVTENGNGTKTIACDDGTSVTVSDGAAGAAGSSCTVTDNGNGTKTVSCDDGTSVTVSDGAAGQDGADGQDGTNGSDGFTSLIRLEAELGGPVCPYSGTKILSGVDDNGDDVLQDEEVDDEAVVCSSTPGNCAATYHSEGDGACVSDTRDCAVLNGTGEETWNGSAWGTCVIDSCDDGYIAVGSDCVMIDSCTDWNSLGSVSSSGFATIDYYLDGSRISSGHTSKPGSTSTVWFGFGFGRDWVLDSVTITNRRTNQIVLSDDFLSDENWTIAQGAASCGTAKIESGVATGSSDWQHFWYKNEAISVEDPLAIELNFSQTKSGGVWIRFVEPKPVNCSGCGGLCGSEYIPARSFGIQSSGAVNSYFDYALEYSNTAVEVVPGPHTVKFGVGSCSRQMGYTGATYATIPAGTFTMGSPTTELGRFPSETQHEVTLTRPFAMATTEVTQGQWKRASGGTNLSYFTNCGDDCPVETVDWYSTLGYANTLSEAAGLEQCYTLTGCNDDLNGWQDGQHSGCSSASFVGLDCTGYRLPTEAEWEYAYRAGTTTAYYNGHNSQVSATPLDTTLDEIGWYRGNSAVDYEDAHDCSGTGPEGEFYPGASRCGPHPVATKEPNSWGLFDMSGNVWEWVWDWSGPYTDVTTNPLGPLSGTHRVRRGGGWPNSARDARAAMHWDFEPNRSGANIGFRLVRTLRL